MIICEMRNSMRYHYKEKYETPEMEIVIFDSEDIITASNGSGDDIIHLPFIPAGS